MDAAFRRIMPHDGDLMAKLRLRASSDAPDAPDAFGSTRALGSVRLRGHDRRRSPAPRVDAHGAADDSARRSPARRRREIVRTIDDTRAGKPGERSTA